MFMTCYETSTAGQHWSREKETTKMGSVKQSAYSPGARLHHDSGLTFVRKILDFITGRPARTSASVFALVVGIFTALLAMPFASADRTATPLVDAALTATSAVTVTGLTSVSTGEHFSLVGQVIILAAIQLGGLGIVTLGAWLTMMVSRRLALRSRILSTESMGSGALGQVPTLFVTVVVFTVVIEAVLTLAMLPVFVVQHGWGKGSFHAVFYAVAAFSNAGFTLSPDAIEHPVIMTTINIGVFAGALGFPVVFMLYRMVFHRARMNLHTRLTLEVTVVLLFGGTVLLAIFEWNNPDTLGDMGALEKVHHALFASEMTRSGGFNMYPMDAQTDQTLLVSNVLMFIGGGSGSTAGGIKVTTLAVLLLAIRTEIRGDEFIRVHQREIPNGTVRVAVAVVAAGALLVFTAVLLLTAVTDQDLEITIFEALSAFGTVGLSNGLTEAATEPGKWILSALMFIGRVGTITLAAGLTARHKPTVYRFPTERPIIG